ncbi:MAG: hypothetical protein A2583_10920 [Bdellovibrionales bacterium RIFOXYD1_FULL_53_11]|nr:MAG: hypothetical protein A2583_10920 [Bdellovibrionales bacterium RIFOXYD1_FULL_53_11]
MLVRILGIAVIAMLSVQHAAYAGNPAPLPVLKTGKDKLEFLLFVREQIPRLFSDAAQYDINLFKLLENQEKMQELLKAYPEWIKHHQNHMLHTFTYTATSNQTVKSTQISTDAVKALKDNAIKTLEALPKDKPVSEAIRARMVEILKDPASADGLLTGLMQQIPLEARKSGALKDFKTMNVQQKIDLLAKLLPETLSGQLKLEQYGLKAGAGKQEVLKRLQQLMSQNVEANGLTALHMMLQDAEGRINPKASIAELRSSIEAIGRDGLIALSDKDALNPKILKFSETLQKGGAVPGVQLRKQSADGVLDYFKSYAARTEQTVSKIEGGVTLKEVPGWIGIFRGCTGGDCATQFSFPYPNDPNERVFFVYDNEGRLKGYASGTIVEVKGKKSFYLITVSGSRISASDTKMIIDGLNGSLKELGVQQLVLPTKENLTKLMNFPEVSGVFESYVTDAAAVEVEIKYTNPEIRGKIQGFEGDYNSGKYDHMSRNTRGRVIPPPDGKQQYLQKTVSVHAMPPESRIPATRQNALEFIMELWASNRSHQAKEVIKMAGLDSEKPAIEKLFSLMANEDGLTVSKHQEEVTRLARQISNNPGYVVGEKVFMRGRLLAPDAYRGENIKQTLTMVIDKYREELFFNKFLTAIVAYHKAEIMEDPRAAILVVDLLASKNKMKKNAAMIIVEGDIFSAFHTQNEKVHLALVAMLKDTDLHFAERAINALQKIKPQNEKTHFALAELLKDMNLEVRADAAFLLGKVKPQNERVHLALAELLKDSEAFVRETAAFALGKINPQNERIHFSLFELLKDSKASVRRSAASALETIKPQNERLQLALVELLKNTNTRELAESVLAAIKPQNEKILFALTELLKDSNSAVRALSAMTLGEIMPQNVKIHLALAELLNDSDEWCRSIAAVALGRTKTQNPIVRQMLFDASNVVDPRTKEKIMQTIKEIDDEAGRLAKLKSTGNGDTCGELTKQIVAAPAASTLRAGHK